MTGLQLKHEIKRRGFTIRQIAASMGKSEQSFGRMLRQSGNVASIYIEKTAEAMGVPFSELFSSGDTITAHNHSMAFKGSNTCDTRLLDLIQARDKQIDKLQAQLDKSQKQIDRLLNIITTTKDKKVK